MEQKKSSTQKQVIEMHQHSQEMKESSSSNYSSEVLEWQKMARKEKVISMSSTQKEQRMISNNFIAPIFTKPLEPVCAEENQKAIFKVEFEASPRPVVKWMRYTFPLKSGDDFTIDDSEDNSSTLIINNTCLDDSGIFTCILENPAGATKSSTNLTIMEKKTVVEMHSSEQKSSSTTLMQSSTMSQQKSSSSIVEQKQSSSSITSSRTMHVTKNDKIRIDIQFVDGSKSDLTFTHNGKPLTESNQEGVAISFSNDIATLTIANAEPKHSGLYECIMKTAGGEAKCSVNCLVE